MPDHNRRHRRLPFKGTIFVELVAPGIGDHQQSEIIQCETLDVSRSGLRIGTNRELLLGAILQIGVELTGEEHTLYLTGEVKWCERDNRGETLWQVGFELLNASDSDIEIWRAQLDKMDNAE